MVGQQARVVDLDRQRRRHRPSPAARQRQGSLAVVVAGRPLRRVPLDARSGRERRDAAGAQIWLLRMIGGGEADEAERSQDRGSRVQVVRRQHAHLLHAPRSRRPTRRRRRARTAGDGIFVDEGPNGQGRGNFSNIWVITRRRQADAPAHDRRPHRRRLRAVARRHAHRLHAAGRTTGAISRTWPRCSSSTSRPRQSTQLTKNEAPESNLAWAPDGKAVTYVAPHDKTWELAQGNLYIHPIEGGGSPTILSANFPGDIGQLLLAPVRASRS